MKATLRWRKLCETYTLLGWDDVLMRDDLPFEYTNGPGSKFWYVPTVADGKVAYAEHIRLGVIDENHSGYVRLMIGSVIFEEDHEKLITYLMDAANRLSQIRLEFKLAKEIIDEV